MKVGGATRAIILFQVGHRIIDVFGPTTRSSSFRPLIRRSLFARILIITNKRSLIIQKAFGIRFVSFLLILSRYLVFICIKKKRFKLSANFSTQLKESFRIFDKLLNELIFRNISRYIIKYRKDIYCFLKNNNWRIS